MFNKKNLNNFLHFDFFSIKKLNKTILKLNSFVFVNKSECFLASTRNTKILNSFHLNIRIICHRATQQPDVSAERSSWFIPFHWNTTNIGSTTNWRHTHFQLQHNAATNINNNNMKKKINNKKKKTFYMITILKEQTYVLNSIWRRRTIGKVFQL